MKTHFLKGLVFLASIPSLAQHVYDPGAIRQKLEKLNVLGTVLYVAAHPDDENTRLITYFANEELMQTAYLSATRGDGGQNLVGPEIREALGVIRTQELLAARRIDGGKQFFSRANDFGYSKHPDETFNIWDKEQVLADFVWIFRKFKPDVVITRFSLEPGVTHGHHTASALLAKEAFELSGRTDAYPEQLAYLEPWQPKKLFWNTSWWFYRNTGKKMDTAALVTVDVGKYNPLLGESYTEVAAKSRSMHKSQGFGSSGRRGKQIEYLKQWAGEESSQLFGGIETSWVRVAESENVSASIKKAIETYDERNPASIIEPLLEAKKALNLLKESHWKTIKIKEIDELLVAVTGLYVAMTTEKANYTRGEQVAIQLEAINRSAQSIVLEKVHLKGQPNATPLGAPLLENKVFMSDLSFTVPQEQVYSHPYWLRMPARLGMYTVSDQQIIGLPENEPSISAEVTFRIHTEPLTLSVPVVFKRTDPVAGEVTQPLTIGPPILLNIDDGVLVFGDDQTKSVNVRVIASRDNTSGSVSLEVPDGWKSVPDAHSFNLELSGAEEVFTFNITPPLAASEGEIKPVAIVNDHKYRKGGVFIAYDHIPKQTLYPDARVRVVKLNLKKKGQLVGYIEGAGDAVANNLRQVGYTVDILKKDDVSAESLKKYDAIVLGVRAFNTIDWLSYKNQELFQYVADGGNVIVQYNTNRRLVTEKIAPYPLTISRDRVAVEEAPVTFLEKEHPVLNMPNKITKADFDGWVQERGLYFPDEWSSEAFVPILGSHDPGEDLKKGGLLIAKHGQGYYIYTGYSWFRELPAGVPGAYRLFVNMLSLGK